MNKIVLDYHKGDSVLKLLKDQFGGSVKQNDVIGNTHLYKGLFKFFKVESGIYAAIIDIVSKQRLLVHYQNNDHDYVAIYYFLSNNDIGFCTSFSEGLIGKLNYNLLMIDADISYDYAIPKNTNFFAIGIFIRKDKLKEFYSEIPAMKNSIEQIFDKEKNTIISMKRMGEASLKMLKEYKQSLTDSSFIDILSNSIIYNLLSDYLERVKDGGFLISKVSDEDFRAILQSKVYLNKMLEEKFPGIEELATNAEMSVSKFKRIFSKIVGITPQIFFATGKLFLAKELLESKRFTVNQVSDKLHYPNVSYFSKIFRNQFGISPKDYQLLIH